MIKKLAPTLWTENLIETVNFYRDHLGFKCESLEEEYGWAHISRDNASIMFALPTDHVDFKGPQFTGSIYLFTEDAKSEWENLKDQVQVCYPLEKFDYGMLEFAIYDNNRYIIQFGQEI